MVTPPHILYDKQGAPRYFDVKRTSQFLSTAYKFDHSRTAFEAAPLGESKRYNARELLRNIRTVKTTIPKKVRETIPEEYGLSDSELGELEKMCRKALD